MKVSHFIDLLLLAGLWGCSFLFIRIAVPDFGPFALVEIRMAIAALSLLPWILYQIRVETFRDKLLPISIVGLINSAIPFVLFAFATMHMTSGFASILNATSPLFGALIACWWLKERLSLPRIIGLFVGFGGVVILVSDRISLTFENSVLAIFAGLLATFLYGVAASFTKQRLGGVSPVLVCGGSQFAAAVFLLPFALWHWPKSNPTPGSWMAVAALGIGCTGIGYTLYFRLIAEIGPAKAISVTFLVPAFAMLFGYLFLNESVTIRMIVGCAIVLVGTALTTGLILARRK